MDMRVPAKPRIALIVDSESWAFANIARQITHYLEPDYQFKIIPAAVIDNIVQVLLMTADCTITHFFWRDFLNSIRAPWAQDYLHDLGFRSRTAFLNAHVLNRAITTSVYDHLFLEPQEVKTRQALFKQLITGYTVSSQCLLDIYLGLDDMPAPSMLAEDGVDLDLFRPHDLDRFRTLGQRPLVIGWAGNSKWSSERGEDFKGLHSLLKPAVQQLQQEGLNIRLELADRQQRHIPHEEMPKYYAQLDLYVCASKTEGTPNPVLEALACGVPVISTQVGVVPQIFPGNPAEMILPERSVEALKRRIRRYYQEGPAMVQKLSEYGLAQIQPWSWANKAANFKAFFAQQMERMPIRGAFNV